MSFLSSLHAPTKSAVGFEREVARSVVAVAAGGLNPKGIRVWMSVSPSEMLGPPSSFLSLLFVIRSGERGLARPVECCVLLAVL